MFNWLVKKILFIDSFIVLIISSLNRYQIFDEHIDYISAELNNLKSELPLSTSSDACTQSIIMKNNDNDENDDENRSENGDEGDGESESENERDNYFKSSSPIQFSDDSSESASTMNSIQVAAIKMFPAEDAQAVSKSKITHNTTGNENNIEMQPENLDCKKNTINRADDSDMNVPTNSNVSNTISVEITKSDNCRVQSQKRVGEAKRRKSNDKTIAENVIILSEEQDRLHLTEVYLTLDRIIIHFFIL